MTDRFRIDVPASTANLGPGFDIFGLALGLYNRFTVETGGSGLRIDVSGDGQSLLPRDETNLFYRILAETMRGQGAEVPPLRIAMEINIPPTRGFGSSSTAIVGGLVAGYRLAGVSPTRAELVAKAWPLEPGSHPDNVTAAIHGGMVINVFDTDGTLITTPYAFPDELKAVCFVPDFTMDTVRGRKLMPTAYSTQDLIFSTSRVALLTSALQNRNYPLLRVAMQDRVHQPYRKQIFPEMPLLIDAAVEAGAHGAALSGGGPTILAFATERLEAVADAMVETAARHGIGGAARILSVEPHGVRLTALD
jgi:homoserine kinase